MHLATLVATARNEGPFFWEWAAHHFSIGFDRIIVFQNDSNDLTHAILKALEITGRVKYFYNAAEPNKHQMQAYQRATHHRFYKDAEWVMALDLDEFLEIKTTEGTVGSLVEAMPTDSQAMLINWRVFGNGGFERLNDQLVTERFTKCMASMAGFHPFKAMFRRDSFRRPGVHRPVPIAASDPARYVNGSGQTSADFITQDWRCNDRNGRKLAQINHYILRDAQSFVLKVARGRAHQIERPIDKNYWTRFNHNDGTDTGLADRSGELREWMTRLDHETGGELSALTARSRKRHNAAFDALMEQSEYQELYRFCTASKPKKTESPISKTVSLRQKTLDLFSPVVAPQARGGMARAFRDASSKILDTLFFEALSVLKVKTLLECGAHEASASIRFMEQGGTTAIAVEANPRVFNRKTKHAAEKGVTALNIGLSDSVGKMAINVPEGQPFSGASSFLDRAIDSQAVEVDVTTIDTLASEQTVSWPLGLWVDVEGYAWQVLSGAAKVLANPDCLVLKVETEDIERWEHQKLTSNIAPLVEQNGFVPVICDIEYVGQFNTLYIRETVLHQLSEQLRRANTAMELLAQSAPRPFEQQT